VLPNRFSCAARSITAIPYPSRIGDRLRITAQLIQVKIRVASGTGLRFPPPRIPVSAFNSPRWLTLILGTLRTNWDGLVNECAKDSTIKKACSHM